ncbi:hypothetical protein ACQPU1_07430 [Clostridium paraputrificum]|uniref:hypothetical protein n=1 Tax=Clostridium TaxID=1485 RepID=UPI003D32B327
MEKKNPIGIMFIGCFQIFSSLALLFTLNIQQTPPFNIRFAMPFIPEILVRVSVAVFAIIIAYGYLRQFQWGYWSMIIYSILFCFISLTQLTQYGPEYFLGNAIYAGIVTIYTIGNRKYFIKYNKVME